MKIILFYLFCVVFWLCNNLVLQAQDGLQDKQLVIEKNKVIELGKASRLQNRMQKTEMPPPTTEQTYQNIKIMAVVPPPALSVKPLVYQKEMTTNSTTPQRGYVKAGFGNYTTILAEGFYALSNKKNYELSFFGQHLSSATGAVLDDKSGRSNSNLQVKGNYQLNANTTLFGQAAYQRIGMNYYGGNPLIINVIEKDKIAQHYNFIDLVAGVHIKDENGNAYQVRGNYYNFSSRTNAVENNLALAIEVKRKLGDFSNLLLTADGNFANRKDGNSLSRTLLTSQVAYQIKKEQWSIEAGVNIAYHNDSIAEKKFRIYPHLTGAYTLLPKKLSLFVGLTGSTQRTSLKDFAIANPFVGNQLNLLHTNKKWEASTGINGNITQLIGYQVKSSIGNYQYLHFYNNSKPDTSRFEVLYDTQGTTVFSLQAELTASINHLKATFQSQFFAYQTTESLVQHAWHRPTWTNKLLLQYVYEKKLTLQAELFNQNGLQGYNPVSKQIQKLPAIIDANLQADYWVLTNLSAFLKINNLFSQEYQQFLYYDNQRFNALLGVLWRF